MRNSKRCCSRHNSSPPAYLHGLTESPSTSSKQLTDQYWSSEMAGFFLAIALGSLIVAQAPAAPPQSSFQPSAKPVVAPADLADIPPLPRGKTTIFGGAIQNFDPVRDQFTLNVVGQRPMHILFDERTQVFRDGTKIGLRDLGPEEHASVETTL